MLAPSVFEFTDVDTAISSNPRVITLFSGGLDSSYLLYRLQQRGCETIALSVDVGEPESDTTLAEITERFGAEFVRIDAREKFTQEAVLPAIKAQAKYLSQFPISSSLSRPIMAEVAVKLARDRDCGCILHTANTSQNSLRRLNGAIQSLGYFGAYGSPYVVDCISRFDKAQAMQQLRGVDFNKRERSGDANLWCREFESGDLDNPESVELSESMYSWSVRKNRPTEVVEITFVNGIPTAVNGEKLVPVELIDKLNWLVGAHGIGRFEGLEHLEGGEKVFEVREAPAAHILMQAFHHLSAATTDYEALREKHHAEQLWVREAIEGRWFGSLKKASEAFINSLAELVTGTVKFSLGEGSLSFAGINANGAMYLTDRDLWEANRSNTHEVTQSITRDVSQSKSHDASQTIARDANHSSNHDATQSITRDANHSKSHDATESNDQETTNTVNQSLETA